MTVAQKRSFYVEPIAEKIRTYLSEVRRWIPDGFYYYRTHPSAHNLEVLMGPDLAVHLPDVPSGVSAEQRARRFLLSLADQLGFEDATLFERQLTWKHTMKSKVGSHCIFELRDRNNKEILPSFFAVHSDLHQRIVMLHCAYQNCIDPTVQASAVNVSGRQAAGAQPAGGDKPLDPTKVISGSHAWEDLLRQKLAGYLQSDATIQNVTFNYDIWLPDWPRERYVKGCQAKVQTNLGDFTILLSLIDQDMQIVRYPAHSKLNPDGLTMGKVFRGFLADNQLLAEQLDTHLIVLRDLTDARGGLHGKYVAVLDNLTNFTLDPVDRKHWLIEPDKDRSEFDRVMVYHHIDLAQRYFRQLGLTLLDDYPELNPLRVMLAGRAGSDVGAAYHHELKSIVLRQIGDDPAIEWTMARDARILYHEFVHAVTDSLARLQRSNKIGGDSDNKRLLEIVQAIAVDEGTADYFAWSLTERQGGPIGEYGHIEDIPELIWKVGDRRYNAAKADLKPVVNTDVKIIEALYKKGAVHATGGEPQPATVEEQYYQWGTIWASYLWNLRETLGPEVTDTIVAHSILFLSRWSGFYVGVCALIQADLLLFAGENQAKILALSGLENDLKVQLEDDSQSRRVPDVTSQEVTSVEGR